MSTSQALPEVFSNEWGDWYYAPGHVDAHAFVLAVVADIAENSGDTEAIQWLVGARTEYMSSGARAAADKTISQVDHCWFREVPGDDEQMELCAEDVPDAQPFTRIEISL